MSHGPGKRQMTHAIHQQDEAQGHGHIESEGLISAFSLSRHAGEVQRSRLTYSADKGELYLSLPSSH